MPIASIRDTATRTNHRPSTNMSDSDKASLISASQSSLINASSSMLFLSLEQGQWTHGTYFLLNAKSGNALDLHGGDHRTMIAHSLHLGHNQQWEMLPLGKGYAIRSALKSPLGGYYLTVNAIHDRVQLITTPFPTSWDVRIDREQRNISIFWPGTNYVVALDHGEPLRGDKVQLMTRQPGEPRQSWLYLCHKSPQAKETTECDPASCSDMNKFILKNAHMGNVLDMHAGNRREVIGCSHIHLGLNQQWKVVPSGKGHAIRTVWKPSSDGPFYLNVESICDGAQVIGCHYPASWSVEFGHNTEVASVRISWPHTDLTLDLAEMKGDTKIQLRKKDPGASSQLWQYGVHNV
ncbi:carbohydrate-binding module family 13 protein [Laetiporus sulphureus 93-53]|uniref:Carbohydrate-binding module family 13 protein n=1 Tax=Laetiporus sulphureus 93-53 TaxID=1314785 RepID=A0A165F1M3_9APHY|nr:carbohydrate-binding module family 13 protein [Laetiporus sulphureus 93-53]KZT08182.1 carbohydrate-binding module family 13 protein [Laetiporus sulphureus 93-53]